MSFISDNFFQKDTTKMEEKSIWLSLNQRISYDQCKTTVIIAIIIGIIFTMIQWTWDIHHYSDNVEEKIDEILTVIDEPTARAIEQYDESLAYSIVSGVTIHSEVYRVQIFDSDDIILAQILQYQRNGKLRKAADFFLGPNKVYKREIRSIDENGRGSKIGYFVVYIDTETSFITFLERIWFVFLIGLIRNAILAFCLSIILYQRITKPLVSLSRKVSHIDLDDPRPDAIHPPRSHTANEIGLLYDQIKLLLQRLKQYSNKRDTKESNLRQIANTDPLTGVFNRRFFEEKGKQIVQRKSECALILFDIDHFKSVNDTLGHDVGDFVIKFVASTISACLRDEDVLARIGG